MSSTAPLSGLVVIEIGHSIAAPYAEWLSLIVIALRVPGKLNWDAKALRFTNSAEANQYVRPVFRKGWELKL